MNAFVTLATNDDYALGALVLCESFRKVQTIHQIACMITKQVSSHLVKLMGEHFDCIEIVDVLDSNDTINLNLLNRPELGITFTKLHCWRLTQYCKAVFMDADTIVMKNIDDIFVEREEFSAAPDPGWPDCFNSGVFVFKPSLQTYSDLVDFAINNGSFDGGDQGLLNSYFSGWSTEDIKKHLPFTDNCMSVAFYSYAPAFMKFFDKIRVVHFIGSKKPWHYEVDKNGKIVYDSSNQNEANFLNFWWFVFLTKIKPQLNSNMSAKSSKKEDMNPRKSEDGICGRMANYQCDNVNYTPMQMSQPKSSMEHQRDWERGVIDYTGNDRFSSIQKKLDESLSKK